jgi:hypothetical protein
VLVAYTLCYGIHVSQANCLRRLLTGHTVLHCVADVQMQADAVAALLLELAVSGGDSSLMNTVRHSVCTATLDMIDAILRGPTTSGTNAHDRYHWA